jgi:predicted transcriptional regulator
MIVTIKVVGNIKKYIEKLDREILNAVREHHKAEFPTIILPNMKDVSELITDKRIALIDDLRNINNIKADQIVSVIARRTAENELYISRELALLEAFGIIKYEDGNPIVPEKIIIEV